ncbi:hypothetical protein O181_007303 [Austropuccinia psidii MF-1]|uniref:Uncharacterized protein n=1 Tax=Austropuccinia psidii MF-1 TaxID=1389203 RepID=A0A9Q3GHF5_9BASI|nr:hypothetical protein [Austropuccinia psidii MF-1]
MSSFNLCISHSGSVHDSDNDSSIEYVQTTQSPMSPNIPLTTPIASSMNVSGLNINVGNAISQTSSTWSIPNISVTTIPPNPSNTQMLVSEGPGSIPEISSKANPQCKFPQDFLLNPVQNLVASQGKVKGQPSRVQRNLSFIWAMKSGLMVGGKKDHWKMLLGVDFWGEIRD